MEQILIASAVVYYYYNYRKNETVKPIVDEDENVEELKVKTVYNAILKYHYAGEDWESLLKTVYQNYIIVNDKIVFVDGFSIKPLFPTCSLRLPILYKIAKLAIKYL